MPLRRRTPHVTRPAPAVRSPPADQPPPKSDPEYRPNAWSLAWILPVRRTATEQSFLVGEHAADLDAAVVDAEDTQLVGMCAAPHLDDGHHSLQPALDLDVTLHDDRVGEKCRAVRAEAQVAVTVLQFRRHENGYT